MKEGYDFEQSRGSIITVPEVLTLRERVNKDIDLNTAWQEKLYHWSKAFKANLVEKYSSTKILTGLPLWEALVGGSEEGVFDLEPSQQEFIETEISNFVLAFKAEHNL